MSDEDVYSVVAYLNSLPPVRNPLPATKVNFPVSLLIKSAPRPAGSIPHPNREDKLKYGEYLATIGGCPECHTQMNQGEPLPGCGWRGQGIPASGRHRNQREYHAGRRYRNRQVV